MGFEELGGDIKFEGKIATVSIERYRHDDGEEKGADCRAGSAGGDGQSNTRGAKIGRKKFRQIHVHEVGCRR